MAASKYMIFTVVSILPITYTPPGLFLSSYAHPSLNKQVTLPGENYTSYTPRGKLYVERNTISPLTSMIKRVRFQYKLFFLNSGFVLSEILLSEGRPYLYAVRVRIRMSSFLCFALPRRPFNSLITTPICR